MASADGARSDSAGFSEEPELRRWLEQRGCTGLDRVEINGAGGSKGLWLRTDPSEVVSEGYQDIFTVPQLAWLTVPLDCGQVEMELAWRLLCERWLGEASSHKPYVDFLWRVDLRHHPIFWDDHEVRWLTASDEAVMRIVEMREATGSRARALAHRAVSPGSGVPSELAADPARLQAELKRALCLVEARATMAGLTPQGEMEYAALVPLVDCMRHDGSESPVLHVSEQEVSGGPMVVAAREGEVSAGSELRFAFDKVGNAQLLAQYGYVPFSDSLEQARAANAFHSVALPIRVFKEKLDHEGQALWGNKLELLASRAGLELRLHHEGTFTELDIDETPEKKWLSLPRDYLPGGRLLPTARFLTQNPKSGQRNLGHFVKLFTGVKGMSWRPGEAEAIDLQWNQGGGRGDMPASRAGQKKQLLERQPLPEGEELVAEVEARAMASEWVEVRLKRLQRAAAVLYPQLEGSGGDGGAASAEPTEIKVDDIVLAHFKARGGVKSRKAKDARVMALLGGMLAVQFIQNGVRHTIPREWVLDRPKDGDEAKGPEDLEARLRKQSRGILALALLESEIAVVSEVFDAINEFLGAARALDKATTPEETSSILDTLRAVWEHEQDRIEEFQQDEQRQLEQKRQLEQELGLE